MIGEVSKNIQSVRERIEKAAVRAGRDVGEITLVAVTKGVGVDRVQEALSSGVGDLGENRVQEALPKMEKMGKEVMWHLIGHLQGNKVKEAVGAFGVIHSVDSLTLAQAIEKRAREKGIVQRVLVEVNVSGEGSKYGIVPSHLIDLLCQMGRLQHISIEGLMTIPPLSTYAEDSRRVFRRLRELAEEAQKETGVSLRHLSMGMSSDFEVAVEEGATLVRVGTALFGPRG